MRQNYKEIPKYGNSHRIFFQFLTLKYNRLTSVSSASHLHICNYLYYSALQTETDETDVFKKHVFMV